MDDDVGDRGELLSEFLLEFAGELVGLVERRARSDRDGDEQHAPSVGRHQTQVTRGRVRVSLDDGLDRLQGVRVIRGRGLAAIGCSSGSRWVRTSLTLRQVADRALDSLGDLVGGGQGAVGRELEVQRDAVLVVVVKDRDVVGFADGSAR